MAPALPSTLINNKNQVKFDEALNCQVPSILNSALDGDDEPHAANVTRDAGLGGLPAAQGLYNPDNEKDSCGVGFVCHIKGKPSHKIVSDAKALLVCMTHRGKLRRSLLVATRSRQC